MLLFSAMPSCFGLWAQPRRETQLMSFTASPFVLQIFFLQGPIPILKGHDTFCLFPLNSQGPFGPWEMLLGYSSEIKFENKIFLAHLSGKEISDLRITAWYLTRYLRLGRKKYLSHCMFYHHFKYSPNKLCHPLPSHMTLYLLLFPFISQAGKYYYHPLSYPGQNPLCHLRPLTPPDLPCPSNPANSVV